MDKAKSSEHTDTCNFPVPEVGFKKKFQDQFSVCSEIFRCGVSGGSLNWSINQGINPLGWKKARKCDMGHWSQKIWAVSHETNQFKSMLRHLMLIGLVSDGEKAYVSGSSGDGQQSVFLKPLQMVWSGLWACVGTEKHGWNARESHVALWSEENIQPVF